MSKSKSKSRSKGGVELGALTGIHNVGEFYSDHYLAALARTHLKPVFDRWKAAKKNAGQKTPAEALGQHAERYYRAAHDAERGTEAERAELARSLHAYVLEALGYARAPSVLLLESEPATSLSLIASLEHERKPLLVALEVPFAHKDEDALAQVPLSTQPTDDEAPFTALTVRDLLDGPLLRQRAAPRWVLVLAGGEVFLIDRHKWPEGRYLRFDLGSLFGTGDKKALELSTALLHREVLVPEGGQSQLDQLDDQSHKHAYGVSTALKASARDAIEILANEAVHYRRHVQKLEVFFDRREGEDKNAAAERFAKELTRECITYLYRLLFLFYVEARGGELGVVPMKSESYRKGYSLETLRDLELTPLTTDRARNGFFLHQSLRKLFTLVQRGHVPRGNLELREERLTKAGFMVHGLRSALFDDERLPILKNVKLRNEALQEIVALLSLSRVGGKQKQRGRVSYAMLGINQLGAVYEGLLSYSGFFAREDLYEVAPKGATQKDDVQTYFLPVTRHSEIEKNEFLRTPAGAPIVHKRGAYIFRLAGRDREKSASYYTPEVLTRCLTKYTLKERLGTLDIDPFFDEPSTDPKRPVLSADEMLSLTILEPAMGSGAFLNEAVNQLAAAYLDKKQQELGRSIKAEDYPRELARVKYRLATQNTYGVDLNPLATELGKVSLWLNVLDSGEPAPYLDPRIKVGNSLVGARRQVFTRGEITSKRSKHQKSYLDVVPERVPLVRGESAPPEGSIFHFLLPDLGMTNVEKNKVLKQLEPGACKDLKVWRAGLKKPLTAMQAQRLEALSQRSERLFAQHLAVREEKLAQLATTVPVWPDSKDHEHLQNAQAQAQTTQTIRPRSAEELSELDALFHRREEPTRQLRQLMDAWCACWFWPVAKLALLPGMSEARAGGDVLEGWVRFFESLLPDARDLGGAKPDAALEVIAEVSASERFFHWELELSEVFAQNEGEQERAGFDVILGNPPWLKLQFAEQGVLGDFEPMIAIRKLSAKQGVDLRAGVLESTAAREAYFAEVSSHAGASAFFTGKQNYPALQGVQTNLYKCFFVLSMSLGSGPGVTGLFHQPGLHEDPKGGALRKQVIERLAIAAFCKNQLKVFPDVHHERPYAFSVFRASARVPRFIELSNLFHPASLDASWKHDGLGSVPGIKTTEGDWDLRGHRSRLVPVDDQALALFAKLYDPPGTPARQARLPVVHSKEILKVLEKFAQAPRTLGDLEGSYFGSECFHETNQQKDETIARETRFPSDPGELILSGPHFYVGTPLNKTPNEGCSHNKDYSALDLTTIPDDYLPRTNYVPACSPAEFVKRTPHWKGEPITTRYKHVHRRMVAPTGERTIVPAIAPPRVTHLDSVFSITFEKNDDLLLYNAFVASLPVDFFMKSTGKGDARADTAARLPMGESTDVTSRGLVLRALRLNCLTTYYADLWRELFDPAFQKDAPTTDDPRAEDRGLGHDLATYKQLSQTWKRHVALRTRFARRQALVEIDALAALALGLTADELCLIYRVQFPVLHQYERDTWYDLRGNVVFTNNKGLTGVGLARKEFEAIKHAQTQDELPEALRDTYVAPFNTQDREEDMRQAYDVFTKRLGL